MSIGLTSPARGAGLPGSATATKITTSATPSTTIVEHMSVAISLHVVGSPGWDILRPESCAPGSFRGTPLTPCRVYESGHGRRVNGASSPCRQSANFGDLTTATK